MALSIRRVTLDELPDTSNRGRPRQPNDFDEHMVILPADVSENDRWLGVPFKDENELKSLQSQLTSAGNHAKVGLSKRVADEYGRVYVPGSSGLGGTLFFKVTVKTSKPRKPKDENESVKTVSSVEGTVGRPVDTADNFPSEQAQSIQDAQTPKRVRKAS